MGIGAVAVVVGVGLELSVSADIVEVGMEGFRTWGAVSSAAICICGDYVVFEEKSRIRYQDKQYISKVYKVWAC